MRERTAVILDFMENGNPSDQHKPYHKSTPILQVIGYEHFTLIEIVLSSVLENLEPEQKIELDDSLPIREPPFEIPFEDLTGIAKANLTNVIMRIISEREQDFVEFFNRAEPLTLKLHSLELLPGIGKKYLKIVLEERKKSPFSSYKDIEERTKIRDVKGILVNRVLKEINAISHLMSDSKVKSQEEVEEKYYLFVQPPLLRESKVTYIGYLDRFRNKE